MINAYLHHLSIESPDPKKLAKFYSDILGINSKKYIHNKEITWMCHGNDRRLIFVHGKKKKLNYAGFSCHNYKDLQNIKSKYISLKINVFDHDTPFFKSGAFGLTDPDQNVLVFGLSKTKDGMFLPSNYSEHIYAPLQHLTFKSLNVEAFQDFYENKLGFFVSDKVIKTDGTLATTFLTSNHEHHTIACFKSDKIEIDHHSYETGEWNRIKDWCDRFEKKNIQLKWGPGRHGPGNNLFIFIEDPDGNWIEISAELEIIHDRIAKVWKHEPKTLNLWGPHSIMRS